MHLTRPVTKTECPWLDADIQQGAEVYRYDGPDFGLIGDGFAATFDPNGKPPFFELPNDCV